MYGLVWVSHSNFTDCSLPNPPQRCPGRVPRREANRSCDHGAKTEGGTRFAGDHVRRYQDSDEGAVRCACHKGLIRANYSIMAGWLLRRAVPLYMVHTTQFVQQPPSLTQVSTLGLASQEGSEPMCTTDAGCQYLVSGCCCSAVISWRMSASRLKDNGVIHFDT